jgi:hypothetical protein
MTINAAQVESYLGLPQARGVPSRFADVVAFSHASLVIGGL